MGQCLSNKPQKPAAPCSNVQSSPPGSVPIDLTPATVNSKPSSVTPSRPPPPRPRQPPQRPNSQVTATVDVPCDLTPATVDSSKPLSVIPSWQLPQIPYGLIAGTADLKAFFGRAKGGCVRFMKISIINETLALEKHAPPVNNWQNDYDKMVLPVIEDKKPCYILYRLDTQNNLGYEWAFICWSPDFSPVREKMLYAATRATLKTEFGGGHIKEELFGTAIDDVTLAGFEQHIAFQHAPAPLTYAEEELEMIRKNEVNVDVNIDSKSQTMQGLVFPISNNALEMIVRLRDGVISYVQLSIDIKNESIELEHADNTQLNYLPSKVPSDHARYHFFNFKHTHEGDFISSIVFIYSTPGYNIPVRERMLYSSCKSRFLSSVEQQLQIEIAKKIEISEGSELTEEFLLDELHPKKNIARQSFAKPKGPSNRGPRRMIRPQTESSFN